MGITIAGNSPCGGDVSKRPGIYAAIAPNLDWLRYGEIFHTIIDDG